MDDISLFTLDGVAECSWGVCKKMFTKNCYSCQKSTQGQYNKYMVCFLIRIVHIGEGKMEIYGQNR